MTVGSPPALEEAELRKLKLGDQGSGGYGVVPKNGDGVDLHCEGAGVRRCGGAEMEWRVYSMCSCQVFQA